MDEEDFFKDYPAPAGAEPIIPAAPSGADEATATLDSFVGGTAGTNGTSEPLIPGGENPFDAEPAADEPAEEECEAVREWRREFAKGLEAKVAAERKYKAERAEQARKTLTSLHNTWTKKASDTRDANRDAEKEFLRDRDALLARMSKQGDAPAWSVIPELVDMSGKFKEGARDTSRMRQVLMKMKTY